MNPSSNVPNNANVMAPLKPTPRYLMHDTARNQTLKAGANPALDQVNLTGRILQIHPIDLESGLLTFGEEPFIVGRDSECDLTVCEQAVSRQHAKFVRTADGFTVTDLNSTNGTWVNGIKIKTQALQSGNRVRIGGRIFKFIATDELEAHYHQAVYSMITQDSLTNVWNKRYLLETLTRENARRQRTGRALTLMLLDLDFFKKVNDTYGHLVGDEMLRQTAERLKATLREEDILARFGGEEFCVVLSETSAEDAKICAERCLKVISEKPFATAAGDIDSSISIGIGEATGSMTCDELIKLADDKLYQAKQQGRNCCQL